jgi:hypothetical protein
MNGDCAFAMGGQTLQGPHKPPRQSAIQLSSRLEFPEQTIFAECVLSLRNTAIDVGILGRVCNLGQILRGIPN